MAGTLYLTDSNNSNTENYGYSGSVITWVVPQYVYSINLTLNGGQGGSSGALGGQSSGNLAVNPGQTYYFSVGQKGGDGLTGGTDTGGAGGYGGGGTGGQGTGNGGYGGGGGGGMSWFSTFNSFAGGSPIILAAGGGGTASSGTGGGTTGTNGTPAFQVGTNGQGGTGGTSSAGGNGGGGGVSDGGSGTNGSFGQGGTGGYGYSAGGDNPGGGGGGGGYYGGGGGGGAGINTIGGGPGSGGGGSSYLGASLLSPSTTPGGASSGSGSISISYSYSYIHDVENDTDPSPATVTIPLLGLISKTDPVGGNTGWGPLGSSSIIDILQDQYGNPGIVVQNSPETGENISANISSYGWLSSTLLAAQQSFKIRPALKAYAIDDNVVPYAQITSSTLTNGQTVQAPDGTLLSVGANATNDLIFLQITDGTQAGQWTAAGTTLVSHTGGTSSYNPIGNASIAVSGYISGSYVIDVYYFSGSTGSWTLNNMRSTNGGVSWSSAQAVSNIITVANPNLPFCSAGQPLLTTSGSVSGLAFFLESFGASPSGSGVGIAYNVTTNGTWSAGIITMSVQFANTGEWLINSLSCAYNTNTGNYAIVFSGYHSIFGNTTQNSLYSLSSVTPITGTEATDIFTMPLPIIQSLAPSQTSSTGTAITGQNLNNFTLPQLNVDSSGSLWLTFLGTIVANINDAGQSLTQTNFYSSQSADWKNFGYSNPLIYSDNVTFFGNNTTTQTQASFAYQNSSYFIVGGNTSVWQYLKNQIICDISTDALGYQVSITTNAPTSAQFNVGNASGQYIGPSPSATGASAVKINSKLVIYQGLYNATGSIEYSPFYTFYIDQVNQSITSQLNDLSIVGRDFYRNLKTILSRWNYEYAGPDYWFDSFNGSTASEWNNVSGNWNQITDNIGGLSPYTTWFQPSTNPTTQEAIVTLSGIDIKSYGYQSRVIIALPAASNSAEYASYYALYSSPGNFIRMRIQSTGSGTYNVIAEKYINGSPATTVNLLTGTNFGGGGNPYIIAGITMDSYQNFNFYITTSSVPTPDLGTIGIGATYGYSYQNNLNASGLSLTLNSVVTIGLGCSNYYQNINGAGGVFTDFQFSQYKSSNNVRDMVESLGTLAGVTSYKIEDLFDDYMFMPTNWNAVGGTFSITNRILTTQIGGAAIYNQAALQNGMVEFDAQISHYDMASLYSFSFLYRNGTATNDTSNYSVTVQEDNTSKTTASFNYNAPGFNQLMIATNALNIDLTQWHHYSILFNQNWHSLFIDGNLVLTFYDNSIDPSGNLPYINTGYVGFQAGSDTTLNIKNVTSTLLYPQIEQFSVNVGDDFETDLDNVIQTIQGFYFSDLWGRMKALTLLSADPVVYTYSNLLSQLGTSSSGQEYVDEVIVIGQGVQATVTSNISTSTNFAIYRTNVVQDYTITTYQQALLLAQKTLANTNKMQSQFTPIYTNDLGAQLFNVVNIANSNTSTATTTQRIYNLTTSYGQGSNSDSIQISGGAISIYG